MAPEFEKPAFPRKDGIFFVVPDQAIIFFSLLRVADQSYRIFFIIEGSHVEDPPVRPRLKA